MADITNTSSEELLTTVDNSLTEESESYPELMLTADDLTLRPAEPPAEVALAVESVPFPRSQNKRPFAIANAMAQAANLENLYQITVTELRKRFAVDRALIYQFQSEAQGTVIAEALTTGYSPALGQSLPAWPLVERPISFISSKPLLASLMWLTMQSLPIKCSCFKTFR